MCDAIIHEVVMPGWVINVNFTYEGSPAIGPALETYFFIVFEG